MRASRGALRRRNDWERSPGPFPLLANSTRSSTASPCSAYNPSSSESPRKTSLRALGSTHDLLFSRNSAMETDDTPTGADCTMPVGAAGGSCLMDQARILGSIGEVVAAAGRGALAEGARCREEGRGIAAERAVFIIG